MCHDSQRGHDLLVVSLVLLTQFHYVLTTCEVDLKLMLGTLRVLHVNQELIAGVDDLHIVQVILHEVLFIHAQGDSHLLLKRRFFRFKELLNFLFHLSDRSFLLLSAGWVECVE